MMTNEAGAGRAALGAAVIEAVRHVRWEAAELLTRHAPASASSLLRARASELAASAAGRDQIGSVARERAAEDLDRGRPPLGEGATFYFDLPAGPGRRLEVQRGVFAQFRLMEPEADALVATLETEIGKDLEQAGEAASLADRMLDQARVHKLLWDDPRIPAGSAARLTMLCSVPRLVDRAREVRPIKPGPIAWFRNRRAVAGMR